MTNKQLRKQIQQLLVASRGLAELPRTNIDAISLDILGEIEGDAELLELARRWLTENSLPRTIGMSDDTKIAWPRVREWMPHLRRCLEAIE